MRLLLTLVGLLPLLSPTAPASAGDEVGSARAKLDRVDMPALRRAVEDLTRGFGQRYPKGPEFLRRLEDWEKRLPQIRQSLSAGQADLRVQAAAAAQVDRLVAFQREALLANPLLDFRQLLVLKRKPVGDPRRAEDPDRGIGKYIGLPQQSSWQLHTMPPREWDNEIALLDLPAAGPSAGPSAGQDARCRTLFRPPGRKLVSELDLHFDGRRMLFSMPDARNLWQVFEIGVDGSGLRQISRPREGVHNLDACYLPNERIAFISTAALQGVPCNSGVVVGMMYVMDADGSNVRQLAFEQDHDFCPTVMPDGRLLYLRWEYTDIPHVWARMLFTMNPDGSGQRELYGSGSYWPNAIFYARPIPGTTKVVGTVTGHHVGRVGETVIFDPGAAQAPGGVVQRVPGFGRPVRPLIEDKLTLNSWPKTVQPFPLSEKYFLVSAKPWPEDLWGIYLVDVFDNLVLLKEEEGFALVEPIPLRATDRPPVLPDRVDLARQDAIVYVQDVYAGPGLRGVPRGTVRRLRLFTYHFAYQGIAGINHRVGADGPWEPKRVLGTVAVEADGSALFRVPANTPISVQPLDERGQALQLMRSWMTAMPGEVVSCVGCHERGRDVPPPREATLAVRKAPQEIQPWYGPVRGFSFRREVQPVLDRYCAGCHDGRTREDGRKIPDLRAEQGVLMALRGGDPQVKTIRADQPEALAGKQDGLFTPSYITLRGLIRVGGLESDIRLLDAGEFAADTCDLVRMIRKGHHGVSLDSEAWDRLTTWIDLNGPFHGTWREAAGLSMTKSDHARRRQLRRLYAGIDDDPEAYPEIPPGPISPATNPSSASATIPSSAARSSLGPQDPLSAANEGTGSPATTQASRRPTSAPSAPTEISPSAPSPSVQDADTPKPTALGGATSLDLGDGVRIELVRVPAGSFVMGDPAERGTGILALRAVPPVVPAQAGDHGRDAHATPDAVATDPAGAADEQPPHVVRIGRPFWMGRFEVTNRQYGRFDPDHDSRFEHKGSWTFSEKHLGWPLNGPAQPVVRVSQQEAAAFCRWLSARTGRRVALPTEAQWEYACRAGTAGPLSFGRPDDDFSRWANLADLTIRLLAYDTDGRYTADIAPRDARFNDHSLVTADVGRYAPNAWGLHDMHGNAWEWTRSSYRPYPYSDTDGRNDPPAQAATTVSAASANALTATPSATASSADTAKSANWEKVVRGGSWRDLPKNARSAARQSYPAWRRVYNVGFRIIVEE